MAQINMQTNTSNVNNVPEQYTHFLQVKITEQNTKGRLGFKMNLFKKKRKKQMLCPDDYGHTSSSYRYTSSL